MVEHQGIWRARKSNNGTDRRGSRSNGEQGTAAARHILAAGGRGPGGVSRWRGWNGGRNHIDRNCAVSLRQTNRLTFRRRTCVHVIVAGIDGCAWEDSYIATGGSTGGSDRSSTEVVASSGAVTERSAGSGAEGHNLGIGCAPGKRRIRQGRLVGDAAQRINRDCRDGHGTAVIHRDGVPRFTLARDLQINSLDEASRVREGRAGGAGDACKNLRDTRGLGGCLNLIEHVGLLRRHEWRRSDDSEIAERPVQGPNRIADIDVVAVIRGRLIHPGLSLGKAIVRLRLSLGGLDLDAGDVLVDVNRGLRAAYAIADGAYQGHTGGTGTANSEGRIPGSGAGIAITGDGEWGSGVRATALDDVLNVRAQHGAPVRVPGGGAKDLRGADVHGEDAGGAQADAFYALATVIAAALTETSGKRDCENDG